MLELKNIDFSYNKKEIFKNFNLKINEKDKILLSAESGKGKTTLFKILLGFSSPNSGEIYFENNKINHKNINELRKEIAYVPQEVYYSNENFEDFIKEVFEMPFNKNISLNQSKLFELMDYFDLKKEDLIKKMSQLSGGEKQRFALITAILIERKIFLLDEPSSALNEDLKEKIVNYFINTDKTLLVISHDKIWKENKKLKLLDW